MARPANQPTLVFDALGTPYIGSQSDDEVKVSTWEGLEWLTEVVDSLDSTWRVSLKFAPDGSVAISYHDWDNRDLRFARRSD